MKKAILAAIMAVFVLGGCGAEENESVRLALDWLPNTNHTGFYVALEKGYYAEEGLDVTIELPPEDEALILTAAGRAEFAISAQESILAAITADTPLPVTAVAALLQHNTSGIVSLKEKDITSPSKMQGHNYATWDMPIEKAILKHCVELDGGDYENIETIPFTVTDVLTALNTDIDTVWIFYGWDGIAAEVKGLDINFFLFSDFAPELDFYTPVLASNTDFLIKNPETAEKFLRASKKGFEYAIENPEEAAEILCAAAPETDKEIALRSQIYLSDKYKAEVEQWGYIDQSRWDAFSDWLYENGLITEPVEAGKGFTNEYLD